MKRQSLKHQFVEFIPDHLEQGIIYISIPYATASHKCFCGCGREIATPLSPTDWKLIFDGETVSLEPSIGNWSYPCQSHYWIRRNKVVWAPKWSRREIEAARSHDRILRDRYFRGDQDVDEIATAEPKKKRSKWKFWRKGKH